MNAKTLSEVAGLLERLYRGENADEILSTTIFSLVGLTVETVIVTPRPGVMVALAPYGLEVRVGDNPARSYNVVTLRDLFDLAELEEKYGPLLEPLIRRLEELTLERNREAERYRKAIALLKLTM